MLIPVLVISIVLILLPVMLTSYFADRHSASRKRTVRRTRKDHQHFEALRRLLAEQAKRDRRSDPNPT